MLEKSHAPELLAYLVIHILLQKKCHRFANRSFLPTYSFCFGRICVHLPPCLLSLRPCSGAPVATCSTLQQAHHVGTRSGSCSLEVDATPTCTAYCSMWSRSQPPDLHYYVKQHVTVTTSQSFFRQSTNAVAVYHCYHFHRLVRYQMRECVILQKALLHGCTLRGEDLRNTQSTKGLRRV